jgi:hypothetical protein
MARLSRDAEYQHRQEQSKAGCSGQPDAKDNGHCQIGIRHPPQAPSGYDKQLKPFGGP